MRNVAQRLLKWRADAQVEVDAEQAWFCVDAILDSPVSQITRENAEGRFLEHIVNVALQGKKTGFVTVPLPETVEKLRGQALAESLYHPKTADDLAPANDRVRETAAKLRRKLQHFYDSGKGRTDPCRIELPAGGYVPRFIPNLPPPPWPWLKWIIALFFVILAAGVVWFLTRSPGFPPVPQIQDQTPTPIQTGLHFLDIQKAAPGAEVHYGTVVRGRIAHPAEAMYLLVLDEGGSIYWVQGHSPLMPCPDGSWERQVWPGDPNKGDGATYTLVVVRSGRPLPDSFPKTDLPAGAQILKELPVRRAPPQMLEPHIASCPPA
jgi:hypothetical protein